MGLQGAIGTEYVFTSEEDLAEFLNWAARDQATDVLGPVVVTAADGLIGAWDWVTGNPYDPPDPSGYYVEGGVVVNGHAMAGGGTGSIAGNIDLSVAETLGVHRDVATGEYTVYMKAMIDGSAAADAGLGTVVSGSAGLETVAAMKLDSSGKLVGLEMSSMMSMDGSYDLTKLMGVPMSDGMKNSGSIGRRMTLSLPVSDQNRVQVIEALNGVGMIKVFRTGPVLLLHSPGSPTRP